MGLTTRAKQNSRYIAHSGTIEFSTRGGRTFDVCTSQCDEDDGSYVACVGVDYLFYLWRGVGYSQGTHARPNVWGKIVTCHTHHGKYYWTTKIRSTSSYRYARWRVGANEGGNRCDEVGNCEKPRTADGNHSTIGTRRRWVRQAS